VLAIGNPFGVGQTVTMGIVSAKGRAEVGIIDYEDFIQTDAAINPGNSGGALVDMEGKLVGINTAILSRSGGYQGIGFAIPTNMARPIVDSLLRFGKVVRGWLGVSIQDVDPAMARNLGLERPTGVLISDVGPNTPAAQAGLKRGDVVLKINGQEVDSARRLRNLVATAGAATTVNMEILRGGKRQDVKVALGQAPDSDSGPAWGSGGAAIVEGLMVEPITPDNRARYRIGQSVTGGAVVIGVESGSPARVAGVQAGDVVIEINRLPVPNVAAFTQLWSRASGRTELGLHRAGKTVRLIVNK
jgi:serine protease Do